MTAWLITTHNPKEFAPILGSRSRTYQYRRRCLFESSQTGFDSIFDPLLLFGPPEALQVPNRTGVLSDSSEGSCRSGARGDNYGEGPNRPRDADN